MSLLSEIVIAWSDVIEHFAEKKNYTEVFFTIEFLNLRGKLFSSQPLSTECVPDTEHLESCGVNQSPNLSETSKQLLFKSYHLRTRTPDIPRMNYHFQISWKPTPRFYAMKNT